MSFPRKRESIEFEAKWIPAFAGMTVLRNYLSKIEIQINSI